MTSIVKASKIQSDVLLKFNCVVSLITLLGLTLIALYVYTWKEPHIELQKPQCKYSIMKLIYY